MSEKDAEKEVVKEELSMGSIQKILWDEIHNLRNGDTSAANLSAITNASGKILSTVALQMKYAEMTGQKIEDNVILIGKKE